MDGIRVSAGAGISTNRIELFKTRNQLRATRGRDESCRIVPVDSPLNSFAFFFAIIRKRGLVTRRWPFSASIRARLVLAIFTYAAAKSTCFKRRRRARIDAENGHRRVARPRLRIIVKETRSYSTGYLRAQSDTIEYASELHELKGRANLAKILSLRIGTPTSRVYGGWHGKGRKKAPGAQNTMPEALYW